MHSRGSCGALVCAVTHIDSDLLWHPLCLVREGHSIAVATTLIASQLAHFKLLQCERERRKERREEGEEGRERQREERGKDIGTCRQITTVIFMSKDPHRKPVKVNQPHIKPTWKVGNFSE